MGRDPTTIGRTSNIFGFQSTRPRGARLNSANNSVLLLMFQSTRPRGARLLFRLSVTVKACFNPRAHVGRDSKPLTGPCRAIVSIHAPTWGATSKPLTGPCRAIVSIHAPTWGATSLIYIMSIMDSFNPRAHVGRDEMLRGNCKTVAVSIHAPTWGATAYC